MLLGIDTGGTFTDFVLFDGSGFRIHKVLSTPHAPEQAIIQGIHELGLERFPLSIFHGSTVATNAVLEGKGVRTVYITNHGFGDMLTIGRQARHELYNLQPKPFAPPVPRELCLETSGRLAADGTVIELLTEAALKKLKMQIQALAPNSIAINLLFSFLDDRFEKKIEAIIPDGIFVSRSSAVLREYKEYERGMTTWLNAWIGPIVEGYLKNLSSELDNARISVMQSSGGTMTTGHAGRMAVHMLLSGPAGGLAGARYIADSAGRHRLLTLDMGGTSTDVAMIDGDLRLTNEGHVGHYPVAIPMVDLHTIGAGGGSIASVDRGNILQVGPQSAGADPGPACYGRGGNYATVTDAHLVIGRLRADAFLGGHMALDTAAAQRVMNTVAMKIGVTSEEAAMGILRLVNTHMAQALRVISVQRGYDPKDFTLVSFGGAGGLHLCELAEALGMQHAIVPIHGGVLSALGMLVAPRARQLSHTLGGLLGEFTSHQLATRFDVLEDEGRQVLMAEGVSEDTITVQRSLDLRYHGQSYTLNIPWQNIEHCESAFHQAHHARYGYRLDLPIELVNIRTGIRGPETDIRMTPVSNITGDDQMPDEVQLYDVEGYTRIYKRGHLYQKQLITGPALITETTSTTFIAAGWKCRLDGYGNLLVDRT